MGKTNLTYKEVPEGFKVWNVGNTEIFVVEKTLNAAVGSFIRQNCPSFYLESDNIEMEKSLMIKQKEIRELLYLNKVEQAEILENEINKWSEQLIQESAQLQLDTTNTEIWLQKNDNESFRLSREEIYQNAVLRDDSSYKIVGFLDYDMGYKFGKFTIESKNTSLTIRHSMPYKKLSN